MVNARDRGRRGVSALRKLALADASKAAVFVTAKEASPSIDIKAA